MPSPTQETTTILDALHESIRELDTEIEEERERLSTLESRRFDLLAEEDRIRGDALAEEYHRAEAAVRTERNARTMERVHRAFVRYIAATHLRLGTVPTPGGTYGEEIEAELDQQRAEVRQ